MVGGWPLDGRNPLDTGATKPRKLLKRQECKPTFVRGCRLCHWTRVNVTSSASLRSATLTTPLNHTPLKAVGIAKKGPLLPQAKNLSNSRG